MFWWILGIVVASVVGSALWRMATSPNIPETDEDFHGGRGSGSNQDRDKGEQ